MGETRVIKIPADTNEKGEFDSVAREVRLAALKGIEALPGPTQVAVVYSLLYDTDTRVRAVARKELLSLPFETLKAFVDHGAHPKVLDFLIRNLQKDSLRMAPLVSAPNLAHRTLEYIKTAGIPVPEPEPPKPAPETDDKGKGALDVNLEWDPGTDEFDMPGGVEFKVPKPGDKAPDVTPHPDESNLGDTSPSLPLSIAEKKGVEPDLTQAAPESKPEPPPAPGDISEEETQVILSAKKPALDPKPTPSTPATPTADGDMTYFGKELKISPPKSAAPSKPAASKSKKKGSAEKNAPSPAETPTPKPDPGPAIPRPEIREDGVLFPVADSAQTPSAQNIMDRRADATSIAEPAKDSAKKPSGVKSFSSGILIGILIGALFLGSWVALDNFMPDWKDRLSEWYGNLPSLTSLFDKEEPPPPEPEKPAPPEPVVLPPVDIQLGKYTSTKRLKRAQKKANEMGLETEYSKKQEKKTKWGVSCGAASTREAADRKARGIRALGIPASVSGGKGGRYYLYCGTLSSESAAKRRAIALRASGYPASVRKRETKKNTYTLKAKNVPADKKDETIEQLKEKGFKPKVL